MFHISPFLSEITKKLFYYAFDALLVIFEIQEFLTCCHIIYQPHQLACSPRVQ